LDYSALAEVVLSGNADVLASLGIVPPPENLSSRISIR